MPQTIYFSSIKAEAQIEFPVTRGFQVYVCDRCTQSRDGIECENGRNLTFSVIRPANWDQFDVRQLVKMPQGGFALKYLVVD